MRAAQKVQGSTSADLSPMIDRENNVQQAAVGENLVTHQTPTTDFHNPFIDRLTLRQSLLRQVVVTASSEDTPDFTLETELAVEERPLLVWLDERGDITLSVLRPSGCLLLFTVSRGLSSC